MVAVLVGITLKGTKNTLYFYHLIGMNAAELKVPRFKPVLILLICIFRVFYFYHQSGFKVIINGLVSSTRHEAKHVNELLEH